MIKIDKELELMDKTLIKMANKVVDMHENIVKVLNDGDKELELAIIQGDDLINHLEEEVNDLGIQSLALLSPVARDLRKVIANIKIASELERIADYAKNIAIYLIKNETINNEMIKSYALEMEKAMIDMLKQSILTYENNDVEKAFEVSEMDENIDRLYIELKTNIMENADINLFGTLFDLTQMIRNIERAGDHIINICEHIIYMIKGQHYDFG